jgi:hypothetical protein
VITAVNGPGQSGRAASRTSNRCSRALTAVPINDLRLLVGGLLLIFGLQWLRKAILRASGFKALHDEDAIFAREAAAAPCCGRPSGPDPVGRPVGPPPYPGGEPGRGRRRTMPPARVAAWPGFRRGTQIT